MDDPLCKRTYPNIPIANVVALNGISAQKLTDSEHLKNTFISLMETVLLTKHIYQMP